MSDMHLSCCGSHHQALAGGTSISQLQSWEKQLGHHQALAGGVRHDKLKHIGHW